MDYNGSLKRLDKICTKWYMDNESFFSSRANESKTMTNDLSLNSIRRT